MTDWMGADGFGDVDGLLEDLCGGLCFGIEINATNTRQAFRQQGLIGEIGVDQSEGSARCGGAEEHAALSSASMRHCESCAFDLKRVDSAGPRNVPMHRQIPHL